MHGYRSNTHNIIGTIAMDSVTFNDLMSSTFITSEVTPTVLSPSPPSTPTGMY